MKRYSNRLAAPFLVAAMLFLGSMLSANAQDLAEIRERGVLRHLGIPYARFITGNGDVVDQENDLIAIGSGGAFAQAAARALLENTELSAREIVEKGLHIAADICIYSNHNLTIEEL